jgi:hypothetical protein
MKYDDRNVLWIYGFVMGVFVTAIIWMICAGI